MVNMHEEIERYVDELYAMHKESGDRMVELTASNKAILERLERGVFRCLEDIKWYGQLFFWLQFVLTVVLVAGMFWALHVFKEDLNWKFSAVYHSAEKIGKIQEEQNEVLTKIKKLTQAQDVITYDVK